MTRMYQKMNRMFKKKMTRIFKKNEQDINKKNYQDVMKNQNVKKISMKAHARYYKCWLTRM
jgi:hypothetical protein